MSKKKFSKTYGSTRSDTEKESAAEKILKGSRYDLQAREEAKLRHNVRNVMNSHLYNIQRIWADKGVVWVDFKGEIRPVSDRNVKTFLGSFMEGTFSHPSLTESDRRYFEELQQKIYTAYMEALSQRHDHNRDHETDIVAALHGVKEAGKTSRAGVKPQPEGEEALEQQARELKQVFTHMHEQELYLALRHVQRKDADFTEEQMMAMIQQVNAERAVEYLMKKEKENPDGPEAKQMQRIREKHAEMAAKQEFREKYG
jgi:hypothetical protein